MTTIWLGKYNLSLGPRPRSFNDEFEQDDEEECYNEWRELRRGGGGIGGR